MLKLAKQTSPEPILDVDNTLTDTRSVTRLGLFILFFGLGGFLLWAAFAPLDEGVPTNGVVSVESKRKAIQHLQGGTIEKILVKEGAEVAANQPLVLLDQTQANAYLSTVQNNYWQTQALADRLSAELNHKPQIIFNEKMLKENNPQAKAIMATQSQLFTTRHTALINEGNILQQSIAGINEQINGLQALEAGRKQQIKLLEKDIAGLRDLVADGFAPRTRLFEMERLFAQISGEYGEGLSHIEQASRQKGELTLRILQRSQEFNKEVETQYSQIQSDLNRWSNEIKAREEDLSRTILRSPTSGHVVGLNVHTIGGIIRPGETLMEIVPENDELVVEIQLPPHLIDKVQPGLLADIRFASLGNKGSAPILEGKLNSISADRIVDPRGNAYFSAKVVVTKNGLAELSHKKLAIQPGMSTEVIIKTGERSLLDYIIRPLLNRLAFAFTEK
ncbi:HlyD family type I secretion periplasmic adaptor subunit [Iodobacter ciconiae]|uniref:Membrane fusion protein (MFP) family protein n=1 Tax=Iodobacter ciconiae TaxID=2496266 RepID=A0A3S8ZWE3_9NEIS|nr:HlyD family type I secretion periplasmic adaptor subunit [Iodobacter ciconiae]AZN37817.1 HlyD family type I secretion periplasmic adaptor subunit [Iodobacter ciconiae]